MKYSEKWPVYARQWDRMVIKPDRVKEFQRVATKAIENRMKYIAVAARTGVTWPHVAVIHYRESSADFSTYLGNGDPLRFRTTHVPRGRGPFLGPNAFVDGAIDALHIDGLDSVKDWTLEKILYFSEVFNGGGYHRRGKPSPYIWGGTNIQVIGKYVRDRVWNGRVWDSQPGCAPILWMLQKLDPSITYVREH